MKRTLISILLFILATSLVLASGGSGSGGGSSSGTSSASGGHNCKSLWSCSGWSYCDSSLEQSRTCHDIRGCAGIKTETKSCSSCLESWICDDWSEYSEGKQIRQCYDEHKCGTGNLKPDTEKSCNKKIQSQDEESFKIKIEEKEESLFSKFVNFLKTFVGF